MDLAAWWASMAAVRYANTARDCWRQVSITVSIVSTKRLPGALCVPKDSFRQITGVTQGALAGVVGRFDPFHFQKGPQAVAMIVQRAAHAPQSRAFAERSAQQQGVHLAADRPHRAKPAATRERPIAIAGPQAKQLACFAHQIVPQAFGLSIARVDQGLEIAFQVGPTPLQAAVRPIHLGPIAGDHAGECFAQPFFQQRGGARQRTPKTVNAPATAVHSQALSEPSLVGDSSIPSCSWTGSCSTSSSYAGRKAAVTWFCIFTDPAGRARLVQQGLQEQRRAALALAEVSHQQPAESDQPRTRIVPAARRAEVRHRSFRHSCGTSGGAVDTPSRAA